MMQRSSHNIIDPTSLSSVVRNPQVPVCIPIPRNNLELGTLISIYGTIKTGAKRFEIDFYSDKCEHVDGDQTRPFGDFKNEQIAFHFNPRIDCDGNKDVVVMNSFANGQWGNEERNYDSFPFKLGTSFQLMILVDEDGFNLAVDGKHLYQFKHRTDFKNIARIHIEDDIDLDLIEFRKELRYLLRTIINLPEVVDAQTMPPTTDRQSRSIEGPKVPFLEIDPNLSIKPCDIYIAGMIPLRVTEHFVINLTSKQDPQQGPSINDNIPVHISIRADINTIVRNTLTDGNWGEEELYLEGPSQLVPGSHFDLMLSNTMEKVSVAIQGQLAFEYKHRSDPRTINALEILGGVVLTSVRFEYRDVNFAF